MTTRVLLPGDLGLYKRIRLTALHTDPDAFGSNYAREAEFDDATWLSRMSGFDGRKGAVLVDEVDGEPTGTVGIGFSDRPDDTQLWGMWVAPESRRTGAAQRLVEAAIQWSRKQNAKTVTLWVVRSNTAAIALYERNPSLPAERLKHYRPIPAWMSWQCNESSRNRVSPVGPTNVNNDGPSTQHQSPLRPPATA
jgi:RimJ/RimL family protein N-acetyltransferase